MIFGTYKLLCLVKCTNFKTVWILMTLDRNIRKILEVCTFQCSFRFAF